MQSYSGIHGLRGGTYVWAKTSFMKDRKYTDLMLKTLRNCSRCKLCQYYRL